MIETARARPAESARHVAAAAHDLQGDALQHRRRWARAIPRPFPAPCGRPGRCTCRPAKASLRAGRFSAPCGIGCRIGSPAAAAGRDTWAAGRRTAVPPRGGAAGEVRRTVAPCRRRCRGLPSGRAPAARSVMLLSSDGPAGPSCPHLDFTAAAPHTAKRKWILASRRPDCRSANGMDAHTCPERRIERPRCAEGMLPGAAQYAGGREAGGVRASQPQGRPALISRSGR